MLLPGVPLKGPLAQCRLPRSACGVSSGTLRRPEGTSPAVATEDEPAVTVPGPSGESQSRQRAWLCRQPVRSSPPRTGGPPWSGPWAVAEPPQPVPAAPGHQATNKTGRAAVMGLICTQLGSHCNQRALWCWRDDSTPVSVYKCFLLEVSGRALLHGVGGCVYTSPFPQVRSPGLDPRPQSQVRQGLSM